MCVYVVRYDYRIDGEADCGNFEFCYKDEEKAEKAMLQDVEDTKKRWSDFGEKLGDKVEIGCEMSRGDNGLVDYCIIWFDNPSEDYHRWWVDKIGIDG